MVSTRAILYAGRVLYDRSVVSLRVFYMTDAQLKLASFMHIDSTLICDSNMTDSVTTPAYVSLFQTRNRMQPSFKSKRAFYKKIDDLPTGPKWTAKVIHVEGNWKDAQGEPMKEELELWMRNPVECAAELLSNPADHFFLNSYLDSYSQKMLT
jgi:hypothetical protein